MKKLTRILALLLVLSLSLIAFSACDRDNDGNNEDNEYDIPEGMFEGLPETTYGGTEITILVEGDYRDTYKSVEICEHEDSPTVLNENIITRNGYVESRFDVKIKETYTDQSLPMTQMITNAVAANNKDYDIIMPYVPDAARMSLNNYLVLLNEQPYIDLDAPCWDQNARNSLSINNKNYFLVGDANLLSLGCTHAIIFNKDLISELKLDDPYELVENGEWTIDKLKEMATDATANIDGNSNWTEKDRWGFLVNKNFVTSMYIGSGHTLVGKDGDDFPYLKITNETTTAAPIFQKIAELVNDQTACAKIDGTGPYNTAITSANGNVWTAAIDSIANKLALFRAMAIIDIVQQGNTDCNFGILPVPKYSKNQDAYHSLVSTIYTTTFAIPSTAEDKEMSAIIIQALTEASTSTTRYAYEQTILKDRKIQDNESEEMFDEIFNGRVYDLGCVFNWGGESPEDANSVGSFMNEVAFSGSTNMTTKLDSIKSMIQTDLNNTIELFKKLD